MFIVVICARENLGAGVRHPGAFTGPDLDSLVQKAINTRREWESAPLRTHHRYDIYAGELTSIVTVPTPYKLVKIKED